MFALSTSDWILLAIAAFIAVTTLLTLMQTYRDDLMKKLRSDLEAEQQRLASEERQRQRREAKQKENAA